MELDLPLVLRVFDVDRPRPEDLFLVREDDRWVFLEREPERLTLRLRELILFFVDRDADRRLVLWDRERVADRRRTDFFEAGVFDDKALLRLAAGVSPRVDILPPVEDSSSVFGTVCFLDTDAGFDTSGIEAHSSVSGPAFLALVIFLSLVDVFDDFLVFAIVKQSSLLSDLQKKLHAPLQKTQFAQAWRIS